MNKKLEALLKQATALVAAITALIGGDDTEAAETPARPALPTLKALKALDDDEVGELAKAFGIKSKKPRVLLATAAKIVAETEDDDDAVTTLATAVGLETEDVDADDLKTQLTEYFAAPPAEDPDDDAPAPSKKKGKPAADEDEDPADPDDDDAPAPTKKKSKKGELTEDEKLAAYNASAYGKKKPLKTYAKLEAALKDGDDNIAEWGKPYTRPDPQDEEEVEVFCCGAPLKDVEVDGEDCGKCQITGKVFNSDLEEVETE